ncbi:MAG: hypothetical protein ABII27_02705 [bacterium]
MIQCKKINISKNNLIKPIQISRECSVCGELNKKYHGFCIYCNERLDSKQNVNTKQEGSFRVKGRLFLVTVFIVVLALILYIMIKYIG